MKLKPYPSYKDSGVEWLGHVPDGWDVKPLKIIASVNDEVLSEVTGPEEEIEYVDIGSVTVENGIEKTELMKFSAAPSRARRKVRDGDVIVSTVRTYLKAIAPIKNPPSNLVCSTGFAVVRPNQDFNPAYAKYSMQTAYFIDEVIARSVGVSYPAINSSDMMCIRMTVPPINVQSMIFRFLDHETGKLDTLISKQEHLIELLQEKRQAIISHAVTKGLNPDTKMKDSGVEWLGMVPEGWEAASIKWFTRIYSGGTPDKSNDSYWADGTIPWLNSGSVNDDIITEPSNYITEEAFEKSSAKWIPKNALVIALAGQGKTKGMVAQLAIDTTCNQSMAAIIPISKITSRFLFWWLKANYQNIRNLAGGDLRDGLNLEMIGGIYTPIPPLIDQDEITEFLDRETTKIDTLIDKAKHSIELAKEHRSALISAAVTGKIDVREAA